MTGDIPDRLARLFRAHLGEPVEISHAALGSVHVHTFRDTPVRGSATHVTFGLSRLVLEQDIGPVRQELLISADSSWDSPSIDSLLTYLAGSVALAGRPLLWGQAIPVEMPFSKLLRVDALLSIDPRYLDEALKDFYGSDPPTVVHWLVPITKDEWEFITTKGADAYLELVEAQQPNLLKIRSKSLRGV